MTVQINLADTKQQIYCRTIKSETDAEWLLDSDPLTSDILEAENLDEEQESGILSLEVSDHHLGW